MLEKKKNIPAENGWVASAGGGFCFPLSPYPTCVPFTRIAQHLPSTVSQKLLSRLRLFQPCKFYFISTTKLLKRKQHHWTKFFFRKFIVVCGFFFPRYNITQVFFSLGGKFVINSYVLLNAWNCFSLCLFEGGNFHPGIINSPPLQLVGALSNN